ncbi:hypothetical protein LZ554_007023 [Drepanopeziza brunnea f. sp. 'monogermtubi']|nr:hypothetical protein LZ554_007023 [Drepanopeziza brunnea f. sp. 'monogermtubi']
MLRSKAILPILLALSFLFNEAQGDIYRGIKGFFLSNKAQGREHGSVIGYATVSREVARHINKRHRPYVPKSDDRTQLGPGFYMVSEPGSWKGDDHSRYCVIKGLETRMQQTKKVYIPKYYHLDFWHGLRRQDLWDQSDERVILEYITLEAEISEPEKALRFSWIKGAEQLRMLIPKNVVDEAGSDFWAQCYKSEEELMAHSNEVIDWTSWDITGHPGPKERLA